MSSSSIKLILICQILLASLTASFAQTGNQNPSPEPLPNAAKVGEKKSGKVSKQYLLAANKLTLAAPYDSTFHVTSFRMTRVSEGPIEYKNDTNGEFTPMMKDLITHADRGDKFYFEYIKCKGKDGTVISMMALSFVIE
jgi:hypothetical protein